MLFPRPPQIRIPVAAFHLAAIAIITTLCSGFPDHPAEAQIRPAFLDENVTYLWPTNASRYMSSSFGETRAAHFHAAMDIGTWGHEGYDVYAARDGILHRVAVGPVGYGNVIYLRHADNSISLYAHLKDFHPDIRAIVDSLRMKDYAFEFDRSMEQFDIRFRRGDHIGWTGSTGVGPPHLHFELRTPDGQPFNPLLAGIRIADTIPPQFSELAVEPLSPDSKIDGSAEIYRKRPSRRGGEYDFGTVDVRGEVGLAVDVFDRANASNNVHAVYELEMFVNGERYFQSRVDSFSYSQSRQMFIDRIYPLLARERKGLQRLYIRPGNTLSFYRDTGRSGRLDLSPGSHDVRIVAADYFGNRSTARLTLRVAAPENDLQAVTFPIRIADDRTTGRESINAKSSAANPSSADIVSNLIWHKNWVKPGKSHIMPQTESESGSDAHNPVPAIRPLGSFRDEARGFTSSGHGLPLDIAERKELIVGENSWTLHRILPDHPVTIYHDQMRIALHFPANAVFAPISVGVAGDHSFFTIFPDSEPLQRPVSVRILLDEKQAGKKGIGLYHKHPGTGNLRHITSFIDTRNSALVGAIKAGGVYMLQADTTGPSVSRPEIARWRHNDRPYATVRLDDDGSGIDHQTAVFKVNGVRGIAEYDPEKKLLRYHHPEFTPEKENEVRVKIGDKAGNITEKTFTNVRYN